MPLLGEISPSVDEIVFVLSVLLTIHAVVDISTSNASE